MEKEKGRKKDAPRQEAVRLDETVKLLFEVSKDLLVKTLNTLFNTNYDDDKIKIDKTATEYPKNDLSMLRADIFISIIEHEPHTFHIEVETQPSREIACRVFEYGIAKAISNWRLQGNLINEPELFMPNSLVIHIEGDSSVPQERHSVKLFNSDKDCLKFNFPVMRYFDYDKDRLIKENLYTLLPLQIFMLRDELDKMTAKGDEQARQAAILKAFDVSKNIAVEVMKLYKDKKISYYDMDRIMIAIDELFTHLNNRYQVNNKLNTEVKKMLRTFIDENTAKKLERLEQAEKKIEEVAINLLDVLDVEIIAEKTNLSIDRVNELKKIHGKKLKNQ